MQNSGLIYNTAKIWELLSPQQKWRLSLVVLFALLTSLMELITASSIMLLTRVINEPDIGLRYVALIYPDSQFEPEQILTIVAIAVGMVYLSKNVIAIFEVFFQNYTVQKINYQFTADLVGRYASADYSYFLTRNSSYGVSVVKDDTPLVFFYGMLPIAAIFSEGVILSCLTGMIVVLEPSLALILLVLGMTIALAVTKWLMPAFYRWGQKLQEANLLGTQHLLQFFHALKEIIMLDKREVFTTSYLNYALRKSRIQAIQNSTNALPRMIMEILFVSLFVVAIVYMSIQQQTSIEIVGLLGGYLYAGFRVMPGLNRIITQINNFKSAIPSIERVHQEYQSMVAQDNAVDTPTFSFDRCLQLSNVSYCYPGIDRDILSSITLTIYKGERIGIVGETGSGKSTLVDIILGLIRPSVGMVQVDDDFSVSCIQWRKMVGYVPQSIYLIDDTIMANITFGDNPAVTDMERLGKAVCDAQLDDLINKLPDGLETIVGERGVRLSGGERQRIAIARALYRDPDVLVFDEATSSLDNQTEALIMETIVAVSANRTLIMVAHRLSTLKDCDRIIEMRDGNIKEILSRNCGPQQFEGSCGDTWVDCSLRGGMKRF